MLQDPNNWHHNVSLSPARYEWQIIRREKTKEVFARDPHYCVYCGTTEDLQIDHIIPIAKGGTSDLDNLQILCGKCNRKKWAH